LSNRGEAQEGDERAWPSAGRRWEQLASVLERKGIRDPRVLAAVRATDRSLFVPAGAARRAGRDRPIPLPGRQVTTQPWRIARMLEALSLEGGEKVLEVGAGYGYAAALCARLARRVIAVERLPELCEAGRRNLAHLDNVLVALGDGTLGYPPEAPFDAILVSASAPAPPPPLAEQLAPGGRLVMPLSLPGRGEVVLFRRAAAGLERAALVLPGRFVPLIGRHGAGRVSSP
jgi:protein-L-isoaspartate(D-aspartate) O-methyltransferase